MKAAEITSLTFTPMVVIHRDEAAVRSGRRARRTAASARRDDIRNAGQRGETPLAHGARTPSPSQGPDVMPWPACQASRLQNTMPPTTSRTAVQMANTANSPHGENRFEFCSPEFHTVTERARATEVGSHRTRSARPGSQFTRTGSTNSRPIIAVMAAAVSYDRRDAEREQAAQSQVQRAADHGAQHAGPSQGGAMVRAGQQRLAEDRAAHRVPVRNR
jgi:hypothetical protein